MNNISTIIICYLLISLSSQPPLAGEIHHISFDKSILTISHHACRLEPPRHEDRKLILQLENCSSTAGKFNPSENPLTQVHWSSHDLDTVWVVATFSQAYQYEIQTHPNQYLVCLPVCRPQKRDSKLTALSLPRKPFLMFSLRGIPFQIPLEGMHIDSFLDQSIGFLPQDVIHDGLPHFGAVRDDWQGQPRKHEGYDIYADNLKVLAAAAGTVTKIKRTSTAGLYVKIRHTNDLSTVYVHLHHTTVEVGQSVKPGDVIGKIEGPAGNAISPQLHFEIQIKDLSVDPLPLITAFYQDQPDILEKIRTYEKSLMEHIQLREHQVQALLSQKIMTRHNTDDNAESIPKSLLSQTASPKKRLDHLR